MITTKHDHMYHISNHIWVEKFEAVMEREE